MKKHTTSKTNGRPKKLTAAAFIKAWQASKSAGEAAKKTGYNNPLTASSRAAYLRMKGLDLKKMPRGRRSPLDLKALKKLL